MGVYLDIKKLGYNPYISAIAYDTREGYETRNRWLSLGIDGVDWLVKSGIFRRRINHVLKYLDLEMKDLL